MLQSADVLLLDEPTNDLDIPTLEVLENSLQEFAGALVLVTHDRYMMDRICTSIIGLDGYGHVQSFADYPQCEEWQRAQASNRTIPEEEAVSRSSRGGAKKKLSYLEAREYESIEAAIEEAELDLNAKLATLHDPAIVSDAPRLQSAMAEVEQAQKVVDRLYARWSELEEKKTSLQ